jgi:hypothetical protein
VAEAAQRQAEQQAAAEAARKLAERNAAAEDARKLAEQKSAEDAARRRAEQLALLEASKREQQRFNNEEVASNTGPQNGNAWGQRQMPDASRAYPPRDTETPLRNGGNPSQGFPADANAPPAPSGPRSQDMNIALLPTPLAPAAPAPKAPPSPATIFGKWCFGSVQMTISSGQWRFRLPDGSDVAYKISEMRVEPGNRFVIVAHTDKSQVTTEFSKSSSDQITQVRGRQTGTSNWIQYNRVFTKCS